MHTCRICGVEEKNEWIEETAERLAKEELCFQCDFWAEYIHRAKVGDPTVVRVDGQHYAICGEDAGLMRGFGGAQFRIRFFDGREVVSTNLWHQGPIPERFREQLPDNARFVRVHPTQTT